ncbi:MAG: FAD-dependent oxidoreductase, partial [Alphaproteobacteria bacterium]|nr:FAD-dependent oxidoreductase [Alphaproteobacteria bacterium]
VRVGKKEYSAKRILIATGTSPTMPDIPGVEHTISSDDLFHVPEMPKRMVVVGGGYIATEFAGILHGLGVEVTQLYRSALFLRGFDHEIRVSLAEQMRARGIDLHFNALVNRIEKKSSGIRLEVQQDAVSQSIETDGVLFAIGRHPRTFGLGLAEAGIVVDRRGYIKVNDTFETSQVGHYALGDLIGRVRLTPVAIREAVQLVRYLFGDGQKPSIDYAMIPSAVFSSPAIATVGLTTEQLDDQDIDYEVFSAWFKPMQFSFVPPARAERNLFRLVVDRKSDRVLAAHLLGHDAPEIMQTLAVAIKAGATKADFDAVIGIHPTGAEELVTMR